MDGMDRRLARLDPRCVRLHHLPADHGAPRGNVQSAADRSDGSIHRNPVAAARGRRRLRLARRSHRAQGPLMISILWYSVCNLFAGLSPSFALLFLFRALLGIGMGAEWPAGAALAMESWPTRSRGLMSGV